MASSIFLASHILLLILFLATEPTFSGRTPTGREQTGIRASLRLVHSGKSKTLPKYPATTPTKDSPIKTNLRYSGDVYLMSLAIGTPPVPFSAIMDTGSNLIWTRCKTSDRGSLFDPTKSKSFSTLINQSCDTFSHILKDCNQMDYEDGKSVSVVLGQETLTVGVEKKVFNDVIFGCGKPNDKDFKFDGIIGMGPGILSLVSQLKKRVFSYCLASRFGPKASSVLLTGDKASVHNYNVQTTPLMTDESNYYISLEGISVGKTKLPITNYDLPASNGYEGRMVIDSGTTFTYLEKSIVDMISNELVNQTNLETYKGDDGQYYDGLEHCFNHLGNVQLPNLVFHFKGADWELTRENYIYKRQGKDMACLAFIASDKSRSIFGNMQQQNMMVIYDLDKSILSFRPATCNEL